MEIDLFVEFLSKNKFCENLLMKLSFYLHLNHRKKNFVNDI